MPLPNIAPAEQQVEQKTPHQAPPRPPAPDTPKFAVGKIAFFQYLTVAVFLFLISGFWDLQVQNPELYSERAAQNSIKSVPIQAPRGRILDRDGRVIVDNQSSFSVLLARENFKWDHLKGIAEGLNLDPVELEANIRKFKGPSYRPMPLKQELTPSELAFVESHRDSGTFPELVLIHAQRRLYPQDGLAAHVVGYVGEISENDLNSPDMAQYSMGDIVGKFGIERQYNEQLMGVDGQRQAEVDNMGRERRLLGIKEAVPGKDLQLTLDLDLQAVAELTLEGRRGAVVALDPRSGEVLAMVSHPAYDPNKFTGHIKASDWNEILKNPDNPMLNRAIQAQQAPGSTFKPIMSLAGLETGMIDDKFKVHCSGGASWYGRWFKCHKKTGHGEVDLRHAIAQSCDVYFYAVGNKLGIDRIAKYAHMAGLGRKTGIDLPQEKDGVVPSSEWKMKNFRQKWYAGETISVSIGQGATTVTPLQLAAAIGGLSTGGVWQRPHLKKDLAVAANHKENLNLDNVRDVINGMYAVVNEGGTARAAAIPGIEMCGKTGTAQLASNGVQSAKDNAWFVGFAPRSAPEIVVVAFFENGEHGDRAAPIARDVIKAYFDKKARLQKLPPPAMTELIPHSFAAFLHPEFLGGSLR